MSPTEVVRLGVAARAAQRAYFADRSRENLIASKTAEAAFDKAAAALLASTLRVEHLRRMTTYDVLGEAHAQVSVDDEGREFGLGHERCRTLREGNPLVVYQADDGKLWVRFPDEMWDGRFMTTSVRS